MLHSNSLFHFTSREGLIGILKDNFRPRFSKEEFQFGSHKFSCWIPLCCFCDIRLSQVSEHLDEYGNYGIGMKRSWAENAQLNPVHYVHSQSTYLEQFNQMKFDIEERNSFPVIKGIRRESVKEVRDSSNYIFSYLKPCYGYDKKVNKEKWFYDEREWRYVPEEILDNSDIIYGERLDDDIKREIYNKKFEEYALKFEPKDINYIVINSDEERLEMIQNIRAFKGRKYSYEDIEILISKIISAKQIISDM